MQKPKLFLLTSHKIPVQITNCFKKKEKASLNHPYTNDNLKFSSLQLITTFEYVNN